MGHHRLRRPTLSDSGYDTNSDQPDSPVHERRKDPTPKSISEENRFDPLFSSATRTDLTPSIGTQLHDIQLSSLTSPQLDELARLVSERGVVFFQDQDLTIADQLRISEHYGTASNTRIVERNSTFVKIKNSPNDHGENLTYASQRRGNEWQSDQSFAIHPPSYSMVKANGPGPDTIWASQYGLYDALSKHVKGFLDELQATHTSSLQYDSIANLRGGALGNRAPVETHHPAVRTHPVTGLKALNVTPGYVSGFSGLNHRESEKLLELLSEQLDGLDEHAVHWKWEAGSVAIWDNRCTAHKIVPSLISGIFNSFETVVGGETPFFDTGSESRDERTHRLAYDAEEQRKTKARFNNTPLRRILRRQTNGTSNEEEEQLEEEAEEEEEEEEEEEGMAKKDIPTTPPTATTDEQQQQHHVSTDPAANNEPATQDTEHVVPSTDFENPVIIVEKTSNAANNETSIRIEVTFRGSPMRRIIQRQISSSSSTSRS